MPQNNLSSSSKLGTPPKLNPFHIGCRNCSKSEQIQQQNLPTSFKAFHSVNFLFTNSQLVFLFVCLVLFTVLSGWVPFLVLITVLSGLEDFSCRN